MFGVLRGRISVGNAGHRNHKPGNRHRWQVMSRYVTPDGYERVHGVLHAITWEHEVTVPDLDAIARVRAMQRRKAIHRWVLVALLAILGGVIAAGCAHERPRPVVADRGGRLGRGRHQGDFGRCLSKEERR